MRTYTDPFTHIGRQSAVALGFFDGLHIGHEKVIGSAVDAAGKDGLVAAVWTFSESPRNAFSQHSIPVITDTDEKKRIMRELGVDVLINAPFTEQVRALTPERFVNEVICGCMKAKRVFCGYNYSFGDGGKGDPKLLRSLCRERGISVSVIPQVCADGLPVSSTRLREMITDGNVRGAMPLLGRPFSIYTVVISGKKIGRTIGFPTLNQVFRPGMLIPRDGVYLTRVIARGKRYFGMTDIGCKPTVGGIYRAAETHIFGFEGDLYGEKVRVEFLEFMRPEVRFESVELLRAQIQSDAERARNMIESGDFGL